MQNLEFQKRYDDRGDMKKMNKRGQNYVYGTAVRKLDPNVQEQKKVSKSKAGARVNNKSKIKLLFHVMFCCALALVMMYRYCLLTEMNYGVSKKYNEYEELRNKNIALRVEIEKGQNLLRFHIILGKIMSMFVQ